MLKRRRKIRLVPIDLDFFQKKGRIRIQPKFVLVAFGDTIKFREWEDGYLVSSWESWKFIERLYMEFARLRNGSVFLKPLADGFMAVKELASSPKTRVIQATEFLRRCYRLIQSINRLLKGIADPPPRGFRIRVVAGWVGRLEVVQSRRSLRRQVDFTGKPVSFAFTLLQVEPQKACVCSQNVKAMVEGIGNNSKRVSGKDLQWLWEFGVEGGRVVFTSGQKISLKPKR